MISGSEQSGLHELNAPHHAVVDIGSNSVRLVIYGGSRRAPIAVFNEKALCGLGRNMSADKRLDPAAIADALATLSRFRKLIDAYGLKDAHVIATAAVRDASDGDDFIRAVDKIGFKVTVVSGDKEAWLAAMGVLSYEPGANGIVGDMGGGSLELVRLKKGDITDQISLPLGPLTLMRVVGPDVTKAKGHIKSQLKKAGFLAAKPGATLYTVGGAWRAIARLHMQLRRYALPVLHHYELTYRDALEICELIAQQSRTSLEEIPGIPRKRIDTLPYASAVLEAVLMQMKPEKIVVSSGGVREGLLYESLSKAEQRLDPLIDSCRYYASRVSPEPRFGDAAFPLLEPLFAPADPGGERRRRAAALLNDVGAYFHPDLRAHYAFETALGAPFVGLTHEDRVWIAIALYRRHEGRSAPLPDERAIGLLPFDDQQRAASYGLGLRFVSSYSPKLIAPLDGCSFRLEGENLVFQAPAKDKVFMGEAPRKRFAAFASAFGFAPVEDYKTNSKPQKE